MGEKQLKVSVDPNGELASVIREALDIGDSAVVIVEAGEETYRLNVSSRPGRLAGDELKQWAQAMAGSLNSTVIRGWETSESAERWVESLRKDDVRPHGWSVAR